MTSPSWRFPRVFWVANVAELFERAAYYGTFIALILYLNRVAGFSDTEAGWVGGLFAALFYFLPFLTGAAADRVGFRSALILAFALLGAGYALLGLVTQKPVVLLALVLVALGGAFVKSIITGTVAKSSDESSRARAYSLFYMLVNIGSFSGKTIAKPVRTLLGVRYIPLYSAGAALIALVLTVLLYFPERGQDKTERAPATAGLESLGEVLRNGRFVALILITAGFWIIQGQLYASMPTYVLRTVGEQASPEWYANINPLVVVLCVVPITQLVRRLPPVTSIAIALGLIPLSAAVMSLSHHFEGTGALGHAGLHPVTLVMVIGIAIQGLAESFLSPRYLEYASRQAPPGKEGVYLGYAHLNTFFAWLTGFIASGYLINAFCPDPAKLGPADRLAYQAALAGQGPMPAAYAHAHYIWYVFTAVGLCAFIALLVFQHVTRERAASP